MGVRPLAAVRGSGQRAPQPHRLGETAGLWALLVTKPASLRYVARGLSWVSPFENGPKPIHFIP